MDCIKHGTRWSLQLLHEQPINQSKLVCAGMDWQQKVNKIW